MIHNLTFCLRGGGRRAVVTLMVILMLTVCLRHMEYYMGNDGWKYERLPDGKMSNLCVLEAARSVKISGSFRRCFIIKVQT